MINKRNLYIINHNPLPVATNKPPNKCNHYWISLAIIPPNSLSKQNKLYGNLVSSDQTQWKFIYQSKCQISFLCVLCMHIHTSTSKEAEVLLVSSLYNRATLVRSNSPSKRLKGKKKDFDFYFLFDRTGISKVCSRLPCKSIKFRYGKSYIVHNLIFNVFYE